MSTGRQIVYVGAYTSEKRREGIRLYDFDDVSGKLTLRESVGGVDNPSFLAIAPDRSCLLATSEVSEFEEVSGGALRSYAIDRETGELMRLNGQPTHGEDTCYVSFDQTGRWAFAGNYSGGSLAMLPMREDGSLGAASVVVRHHGHGPQADRQEKAHVHCVRVDPTNQVLFVTDLGLDQIVGYRLNLTEGRLDSADARVTRTAPGAGPRHIEFHPNGRFMYVSNELNSTVCVYALDLDDQHLTELQTLSTLPDGYSQPNDCADLHITPDGRYLYVSNRGHDSLAGYAVDADSGLLTLIGFNSAHGHWPRNFGFDVTGTYVFVAHQKGNSIATLRLNAETGALEPTGEKVDVKEPVCVLAMAL